MEAFALPLRALLAEAAWFARAKEVRLLHVVVAPDLADGAIKACVAQEFHADNRSPFVRFDDVFTGEDPGWKTRAARLRDQHDERRKALAQGGIHLRPLAPPAPDRDALAAFAAEVRSVIDTLVAPLEGLVIVLAPTRVEDPARWAATLRSLIHAPRLAAARWIVVDREEASAGPVADLARSLEAGGLSCRCIADDAAIDREVAAMLDRAADAPAGAPGPAMLGAAWPKVKPPPRPGRPQPSPAELKAAIIAAGVEPPITPDEGQRLRALILRAAQALKAQRGPEAVRLQREARDLCDELGMPKEAVLMELTLASYLVYLGQRPLAIETYQKATARAEVQKLPNEGAQAQLAIGALQLVDKRPDLAAATYGRAAELARAANVPVLAIEAYRLCGTYVPDNRLKVQVWQKALEVAGALDPDTAKSSSAAEVARALAAHLRKLGMHAQADHVERQSLALEAGEAPSAEGAA